MRNKWGIIMVQNAVITDVSLTMLNAGCLTFHLLLEGDGWSCSFGERVIGKGYLGAKPEELQGSERGLAALMRVMQICGVESWEDVPGCYVRAVSDGWGSNVTAIGHIIKNDWFDLDEFFNIETRNEEDAEEENDYEFVDVRDFDHLVPVFSDDIVSDSSAGDPGSEEEDETDGDENGAGIDKERGNSSGLQPT